MSEKLQYKIVSLIVQEAGVNADTQIIVELRREQHIEGLARQLIDAVKSRVASTHLSDDLAPQAQGTASCGEQLPDADNEQAVITDNQQAMAGDGLVAEPSPAIPASENNEIDTIADNAPNGSETLDVPPPLQHAAVTLLTDQPLSEPASAIAQTDVTETPSGLPTPQEAEEASTDEVDESVSKPSASERQLRPGEVPARGANADRLPPPRKTPEATICLPNARVGEAFNARVNILLDNGATAEVTDMHFPQDIGLTFIKEEQRLKGIPTESGDVELTVKWSCASQPDNEKKLLFVVNPDPKSLWKVIDPPADALYFKESIVQQSLAASGVNIAAASRRGRSHEHAGTFRDDDFYINNCGDSGWSLLLVADGAGSAPYSREGSRIVAETIGNYLFGLLKEEKGYQLKEWVVRWNGDDQRAVWQFMNHYFRQAALLAINNISSAAILAEDKVKSFATTVLATITCRDEASLFAASFWLGDGAIAAYGPVGKVRILGAPDSGEYAGQTRFLDAEVVNDAGFSKRISIGKWNDVSHLLLMTDGVSDPWFETDNGLQNPAKWDSLMTELAPVLSVPDQASSQLLEWLNFFSPGNHDDRTIIVLW